MVDFDKLNKEANKTTYAIEPIVRLARDKLISDGGTRKKASALEGRWIRLNEIMFAFEEADKVTLIHSSGNSVGCACGRCDNGVMCEHLIAFEDLKSLPQLSIEAPEFNWLKEYLFSLGWYAENRYLYPSLDADEPAKIDPVNEDKDLDIGVDDGPAVGEPPESVDYDKEPVKTIERKCDWCGHVEKGEDRETVIAAIAEHRKICPKNPSRKKKEAPKKPADRETATPKETKPPRKEEVKEPSGAEKPKENKKVKQPPKNTAVSTEVLMPSDAEFRDAKTERILQSQGGFYKVAGGKEVPDAAAVQAYAVGKAKISTEVILVEQDKKHVLVVIRCHREDVYTDASVYIDFDTQRKRELLKVANKNPKAVRGWDENGPVFDPEFKVVTEKKSVPLMVHLFNRMTDFAYFAPRTAESQAIRRGQAKMLGSEWRDAEEINTEAEEVDSVNKR